MIKFLKNVKREFFYLRKAFSEHNQGFTYLNNRYFLAPKIFNFEKELDRPPRTQDLSIHILTSHTDLTMLLWSLASFYEVFALPGQLFIHSDGSHTSADITLLKKRFKWARIVVPNDLMEYPLIKEVGQQYPRFFLLRKLLDPYFVSEAPMRLVIDSDLLWFLPPLELLQAVKGGGKKSLMMSGNSPCYVYFTDGTRLAADKATLNSGIVFYGKQNFSLRKLNDYLQKIDWHEGRNAHFIEQAGYAMALENLEELPPNRYSIKQNVASATVMRHYTSPRRHLFYLEGLLLLKKRILGV